MRQTKDFWSCYDFGPNFMHHQLQDLDLNSMRLLKALVERRSTKLAAEQLGISQATASRGLTGLKAVFGEMLFVRKSHGIEPSALAIQLASVVDEMVLPIQQVLQEFDAFSATNYRGEISIVADSIYFEEQGERLISKLYSEFPNATLSLYDWDDTSQESMLEGKFDYCIIDNEVELPQDIYLNTLFKEDVVIIAKEDHPTLGKENSWQDIAELPLIILPPPEINTRFTTIESEYARRGFEPKVLLRSFNIRIACQLLRETDAIMFSSTSTTKAFAGVKHFAAPQLSSHFRSFTVYGGYLQTNRNHPLYSHLHKTIASIFTGK